MADSRGDFAKQLAAASFGPPTPTTDQTAADERAAIQAEFDALDPAPPTDPRQQLLADAASTAPSAPTRYLGDNGQMQDIPKGYRLGPTGAGIVPDGSAPSPLVRGNPAAVVRATAQQPAQRPAPTPGVGVPNVAGQIGKTYDQQMAAQSDVNRAAVNANDAQSVGDARVAGLQSEQAEDEAKRAKEHDDAVARQLAEIHALSDDAAAMKVDSNRWWHNQSTGQQVGYTIAAALGGFAAGWNKGPNLAMDQINRNIDRDIDDQKTAIEQARGKVTDARGILGEMYTRFGTMDKAVAATKLLQINSAINDTKAQVTAAQSPGVEANGNVLLAGLQRDKILAQQRFAAASQPNIDFGKLHELSKDLEGDRSVAGEQALANLQSMDKTGQGDIPGSSLGGRILGSLAEPDEGGRRGFVASLANAARGHEAREASGGMYQLAEASLPPSIRGSPEAVRSQMRALFGSGTPEEVKAGMDKAQALIGAQRANAYAGQKPETVAAYEMLNKAYGARTAPKPGLPSGSTP